MTQKLICLNAVGDSFSNSMANIMKCVLLKFNFQKSIHQHALSANKTHKKINWLFVPFESIDFMRNIILFVLYPWNMKTVIEEKEYLPFTKVGRRLDQHN